MLSPGAASYVRSSDSADRMECLGWHKPDSACTNFYSGWRFHESTKQDSLYLASTKLYVQSKTLHDLTIVSDSWTSSSPLASVVSPFGFS